MGLQVSRKQHDTGEITGMVHHVVFGGLKHIHTQLLVSVSVSVFTVTPRGTIGTGLLAGRVVLLHCASIKKTPDIFHCNSSRRCWILIILAQMFCRKQAIGRRYILTSHLVSVSALPCKTESTEILFFHLNVVRCFANRHTNTSNLSPGHR